MNEDVPCLDAMTCTINVRSIFLKKIWRHEFICVNPSTRFLIMKFIDWLRFVDATKFRSIHISRCNPFFFFYLICILNWCDLRRKFTCRRFYYSLNLIFQIWEVLWRPKEICVNLSNSAVSRFFFFTFKHLFRMAVRLIWLHR